jgi:hypothetical protein
MNKYLLRVRYGYVKEYLNGITDEETLSTDHLTIVDEGQIK